MIEVSFSTGSMAKNNPVECRLAALIPGSVYLKHYTHQIQVIEHCNDQKVERVFSHHFPLE